MSDYHDLVTKVEDSILHQDLDDVIPVLTSLLAQAGHQYGAEKKGFIAYLVSSVDLVYQKMDADREHKKNLN